MIRIHIARNRQPLGDFSPDEVARGLESGKFVPSDLAWREPMATWKPLADFDDLPQIVPPGDMPPPLIMEAPLPPSIEPAWERKADIGFIGALVETLRQIYATPRKTFAEMKLDGGLRTPLSFYVIIGTLSLWVAIAYQVVTLMVNPEILMKNLGPQMTTNAMLEGQILMLFVTPLFFLISAFVGAGIFHFLFSLFKVDNLGFEATFRAYCYAAGAASLMFVLPFCGGAAHIAMYVIFLVIALAAVHRAESWKAAVVVVTPTLLCCGALVTIYGAAMAAVMQAVK